MTGRLLLSPPRKGRTFPREAAEEAAEEASGEPGAMRTRLLGPMLPSLLLRLMDREIFSLGSFCGLGLLFLQ